LDYGKRNQHGKEDRGDLGAYRSLLCSLGISDDGRIEGRGSSVAG